MDYRGFMQNICHPYLKYQLKYVHHGIPLPPIEETKNNKKNGHYLLSINRIVREKGIEDSIDLVRQNEKHYKNSW